MRIIKELIKNHNCNMKKHICLLLVAMIILQKSDAQSFQELFGIIKKEFNVMLQKNAARLTQQGM
jgi:hypothetical protein